MKLYKKTGVITLEDGVEIENPIWGWADTDQMYMNGEDVQLRVEYFAGENQTVATASRWYTFNIVDVIAKITELGGDMQEAGRQLLLSLPQHENSTEV